MFWKKRAQENMNENKKYLQYWGKARRREDGGWD